MLLLREIDTQFQSQFHQEMLSVLTHLEGKKPRPEKGHGPERGCPSSCATGKAAFSSFTSIYITLTHTAFAHKNIKWVCQVHSYTLPGYNIPTLKLVEEELWKAVAHECNANTQEAEVGESGLKTILNYKAISRPAWGMRTYLKWGKRASWPPSKALSPFFPVEPFSALLYSLLSNKADLHRPH